MNHKTKIISILLLSFSLMLSGYTAGYAEVEPLVLPEDSLSLDDPEAQRIMNDAFERSGGAADAYTPDASGLNSYGYDPYALDYELSYLSDTALDAYQYNLDIFGGDPYAAYDQVAPDIEPYGWDDSGYADYGLPDDGYWDLETIGSEGSSTSGMVDLPLTRIERDNLAISGAADLDEAKEILYDMAAVDGLDPGYIVQDEKVIVWDELDNVMMGEGFMANEITHSVEEAYANGDISLEANSIEEMIAEMPIEEQFDFKGRVAEVQFGLRKPWDKGVYEKDGRLTHEYEVFSPNTTDLAGFYHPYLDTVVYSGAAIDMRVRKKEVIYDHLQDSLGSKFVIPEFEKARSEGRLRELEGAGLRRHERKHVDDKNKYEARYSDMTTSDFFDGDAQRVEQVLSNMKEIEAHHAALKESEYPQMDLINLEYNRMADMLDVSNQTSDVDSSVGIASTSINGNKLAENFLVTDTLKAYGFPEKMANLEASDLGDGYVTELETDITRQKIEDGTYLNDPEYSRHRILWLNTLPADQLRTRFKNTHDDLADTIIPELPPKDSRY